MQTVRGPHPRSRGPAVIGLVIAYAAIACLVLATGLRLSTEPADVAIAIVEAALWPAILVLAIVGAGWDAARARWA